MGGGGFVGGGKHMSKGVRGILWGRGGRNKGGAVGSLEGVVGLLHKEVKHVEENQLARKKESRETEVEKENGINSNLGRGREGRGGGRQVHEGFGGIFHPLTITRFVKEKGETRVKKKLWFVS